jgi:cobalt/nickel transport system ATP-binding protein
MIELRDVSFSYPETAALCRIDLRIEEGDSVAIIGPNGSGKSTLLRLICGLATSVSGSYRFDGETMTAARLSDPRFAKAFHRRVGFLFQDSDAQLFCGSVRDEIAFGPRQMGLRESDFDGRVADLVGLFDLGAVETRVPYHLSGGEKRKVALASVLALNPEVLCLDEPMGGLDPRTKSSLRGLIATLNAAGKTIICATHDFEYVGGLFRRAVALSREGRLVRDGPYDEIIGDRDFLEAMNII